MTCTCIYMYLLEPTTLYSRQSALPTELPMQLSWLGPNLTSHSTPDEHEHVPSLVHVHEHDTHIHVHDMYMNMYLLWFSRSSCAFCSRSSCILFSSSLCFCGSRRDILYCNSLISNTCTYVYVHYIHVYMYMWVCCVALPCLFV